MTTQNEREIAMYGCTQAAIDKMITKGFGHPMMLAMSMMSDAQEMMERGMLEGARQVLNRAKYVVSEVGFKDLDKPAGKTLTLTPAQASQAGMALNERARWLRSQSAYAHSIGNTEAEARHDEAHEATMAVVRQIYGDAA